MELQLLCKIVTTSLSAERAIQLFLELFTRLCQEERLFHIRKVAGRRKGRRGGEGRGGC